MAAVEYTIVKAASSGDLETCEKIMREIYQENPRHWPYGLTTDQLRGNLYMVRQASTNEPVGFVGWQEAREGLRKVGYYSIGILPQYRQQGFAKSAVQQIIAQKSAGVDEVRALIHYTNRPSLELADALNVPVEKVAGWQDKTLKGLKYVGAPSAITAAQDTMIHGEDSFLNNPEVLRDPRRLAELLITAAGNFTAPHLLGLGGKAVGRPGGKGYKPAPGVTATGVGAYTAATTLPWYKATSGESAHGAGQSGAALKDMAGTLGLLLPVLGLGGLGLAGYKAFKKEEPQQISINQPPQPGKIRVTLPTKNPGDSETQVELPFDADAMALSHNIQGTLSRDVRRRLLDEAKHRRVRKGTRRLNTASDPARLRIAAE